MPSPFPGMDPYLENPVLFPDLHDAMITYLRGALQRNLPEPYYAGIGSQTWVAVAERYRVPHDPKKRTYVEVFHPKDGGRLVTTIEILSPTNKTPGEHGRDLYLRKQAEILASKTHLIEIDLLRAGQHTTAVPHARLTAGAGAFDYHVCLHRFDNWEDYFVYAFRLADRLPEIAVPLLPGDGDVPLDLQAVLDRCYDEANYRRRVRYGAQGRQKGVGSAFRWPTWRDRDALATPPKRLPTPFCRLKATAFAAGSASRKRSAPRCRFRRGAASSGSMICCRDR